MNDLGQALARLFAALSQAGSPACDLLRPGLSAERIAELAAAMPAGIPAEVETLHRRRDGVAGGGAPEQELFPGGFWLSLEQALELREQQLQVAISAAEMAGLDPATVWRPAWLPLFVDFAGNAHVVVCEARESSPVWFVAGDDPDDRRLAFDSIAAWAQTVATCWEESIFAVASGGVEADGPRFHAVLRSCNPAAAAGLSEPERLERDLGSDDPNVRAAAARMSGEGADRAPVAALRRALDDPDDAVRSEAAAALGRMDDLDSAERLTAALDDASGAVRARAAWAIGRLGYEPAVPVLAAALQDPELPVRIAAARALLDLRSAESIPALVAATASADPVPDVKRLAVAALAGIRHPDAVAAISPLADDDDPVVREIVRRAASGRR